MKSDTSKCSFKAIHKEQVQEALSYLHSFIQEERALTYQRFFKTSKGEYGYGDKFLGITVPNTRKAVARYYQTLSLAEISSIIKSQFHEERLFALLVLVAKYEQKQSNHHNKSEVFTFYKKHMSFVNNWDLVDASAPKIVGDFLYDIENDTSILRKWATSKNLWTRRIAIVTTLHAIKKKSYFEDTLAIATILLKDKHDLIHKATGWMIREVGKKDLSVLYSFLDRYHKIMPRTMLRYAIEKLDDDLRLKYMKKHY
ncbi:MAG TPA: DNA alkylation repair protein [Epsilonproteobacteria bacterium]|nr:DNA alkylation repair protein [Campylobacterota bacterium]